MTIYCAGRNYRKHAEELGNEIPESPVIFLKSQASRRGFTEAPVAFQDETFHFEAELVFRIQRDIAWDETVDLDDIGSFFLGIDLTRRSVQSSLKSKGLPWTMAKSFMGSAILGKERAFHGEDLNFEFFVNGERRQVANTRQMLFPLLELCRFIHSFSPLRKGDLIFTGTPEGVGEIRKGDRFIFRIGEEIEEGVL